MSTSLVEKAPRYLSPGEAAELVGVPRETIYRHVRRGILPAVRLGRAIRIPEAELRADHAWPTSLRSCIREQQGPTRSADRVIAEDDERRRPSRPPIGLRVVQG